MEPKFLTFRWYLDITLQKTNIAMGNSITLLVFRSVPRTSQILTLLHPFVVWKTNISCKHFRWKDLSPKNCLSLKWFFPQPFGPFVGSSEIYVPQSSIENPCWSFSLRSSPAFVWINQNRGCEPPKRHDQRPQVKASPPSPASMEGVGGQIRSWNKQRIWFLRDL